MKKNPKNVKNRELQTFFFLGARKFKISSNIKIFGANFNKKNFSELLKKIENFFFFLIINLKKKLL